MYLIFANIVLVVHTFLIIGVFLGILVSILYKRFRPIEAILLLTAIVVWSVYGGCPLTHLENYLREQGGSPIPLIPIGFIPYYLQEWFELGLSGRSIEIMTYAVAGAFALLTVEWEWPFFKSVEKRGYKIYRRARYK